MISIVTTFIVTSSHITSQRTYGKQAKVIALQGEPQQHDMHNYAQGAVLRQSASVKTNWHQLAVARFVHLCLSMLYRAEAFVVLRKVCNRPRQKYSGRLE